MIAVDSGALAWLSPSPSGLPPSPPPKKVNITQRSPSGCSPASESALMVPYEQPIARSGAASATAPKITSMIRRIVSV